MTLEEFDILLNEQKYNCPICKKDLSKINSKFIHVDHDHSTGVIRGIICNNCNTILGHCNDDSEILRSAIEYLSGEGSINPMLSILEDGEDSPDQSTERKPSDDVPLVDLTEVECKITECKPSDDILMLGLNLFEKVDTNGIHWYRGSPWD
jgi:hypothetical protein